MIVSKDLQDILEDNFEKDYIQRALNAKRFHKYGKKHEHGSISSVIDIDLCSKLYLQFKMPIYKIATLYDVSDVTLREYLIKNDIQMRCHNSKDADNNFFECIDTKEKAYFLGLVAADGCVILNNGYKTFSISLNEEDGYIIDYFVRISNLHIQAKTYCRTDTNSNKIRKTRQLVVRSQKIFDDLSKYNILPNKSIQQTVKIPDLEEHWMSHYIRGYFDGNGISFKDGKIGFCGSQSLMTSIRNILIEKCNATYIAVTYNKTNHIYYIAWRERHSVVEIYKYLYKDSQNLFLKRKKDKIENSFKARGIEIC